MKLIISTILLLVSFCSLYAQSRVIATVNDSKITLDDIQVILAGNPNAQFDSMPEDVKSQVISKAIDKELLTEQALKSNIDKSKDYKSALAVFRKNLIFNLWLKKESEKLKISKSEIKKYYKENKDSFSQKASVKASHILLKEESEAKKIIKKLLKSKNLKEDFAQEARDKSVGPSSKSGGSLGWFEKERMVPEFSKAAFKLKKNSITKKPVKTQFGYHVIYVEDKKRGGVKKLSEAKEQITNILKSRKFKSFIDKRAKTLREKAKIKILDK